MCNKIHPSKKANLLKGMDDYLLNDFEETQREYIIKELYPSLHQGLVQVSCCFDFHFYFYSSYTNQCKTKRSRRRLKTLMQSTMQSTWILIKVPSRKYRKINKRLKNRILLEALKWAIKTRINPSQSNQVVEVRLGHLRWEG